MDIFNLKSSVKPAAGAGTRTKCLYYTINYYQKLQSLTIVDVNMWTNQYNIKP